MVTNWQLGIFFGLIFFFVGESRSREVIYIIPPAGYEQGRLFNLSDTLFNRDDCVKHFSDLKDALARLNCDLVTADPADDLSAGSYIIMSGYWTPEIIGLLSRYDRNKLIALIWEPTTINAFAYDRSLSKVFSKIFIMHDGYVDGENYLKLNYPHPILRMTDDVVPYSQKKLCTHVSSFNGNIAALPLSELYSERIKSIREFSSFSKDFVFFGKGWSKKDFPSYGGSIVKKLDVLKNYRFSICFENTRDMPGYISEKIFDSFQAGCVPIYLGAPNVTSYVPKNCFVDFRDFAGYVELFRFLENVSEEEYDRYLFNIKKFLCSKAAFHFSISYFVDTVISAVKPGYDKRRVFGDFQTVDWLS